MGCFSTCFNTCKPSRRRRRRRSLKTYPSLLDHLQNYQSIDDFQVLQYIQEEQDGEKEEQRQEREEKAENPSNVSLNANDDEKLEKANMSGKKKVSFDLNLKYYENLTKDEEEEEEADEINEKESVKALNHRYQNCRDSDDEFDALLSSDESDLDYYTDDYDEDEDDDDEMPVKDGPLNYSNSRYDRTKYVDSVMNPVGDITQWKDIKSKSRLVSKDEPKENLIIINSVQDFSFPVKKEALQSQKEIRVDTSLSTWLVGSEEGTAANSSISVGNSQSDRKPVVSPNKYEDRPILGALTVEEIRKMSASLTPRKAPRRSPDDMPIIGSVGSYWSHTTESGGSSTKSTKSRYRESAEVMWDCTPFETRLEKALEKEANAQQVFAV